MADLSARLEATLGSAYRIERELGAGGMATVHLAHHLRHDRDVAIKVLHPELGAALDGGRYLLRWSPTSLAIAHVQRWSAHLRRADSAGRAAARP